MMFELSPVKICVLQERFLLFETEKKTPFSFHFLPKLKDKPLQPFTLPRPPLCVGCPSAARHALSTTEVQALGLLPARHEGQ